jgi:hypothetical protein
MSAWGSASGMQNTPSTRWTDHRENGTATERILGTSPADRRGGLGLLGCAVGQPRDVSVLNHVAGKHDNLHVLFLR